VSVEMVTVDSRAVEAIGFEAGDLHVKYRTEACTYISPFPSGSIGIS
jgi:hypothetical protein